MLDSLQVPARYARYARQFSSPCSIVRYLDSFQVPARYAQQFSSPCSICSIYSTVFRPRVTDIVTVLKSLLDSLIPRQFSSPCSICSICSTVFKSLLDMLDSFQSSPCSICSTVFKSLLDMLDMLDSFQVPAR